MARGVRGEDWRRLRRQYGGGGKYGWIQGAFFSVVPFFTDKCENKYEFAYWFDGPTYPCVPNSKLKSCANPDNKVSRFLPGHTVSSGWKSRCPAICVIWYSSLKHWLNCKKLDICASVGSVSSKLPNNTIPIEPVLYPPVCAPRTFKLRPSYILPSTSIK